MKLGFWKTTTQVTVEMAAHLESSHNMLETGNSFNFWGKLATAPLWLAAVQVEFQIGIVTASDLFLYKHWQVVHPKIFTLWAKCYMDSGW
jgi:hypothetical protein